MSMTSNGTPIVNGRTGRKRPNGRAQKAAKLKAAAARRYAARTQTHDVGRAPVFFGDLNNHVGSKTR